MFQHTAARRRLFINQRGRYRPIRFNTQPPEGGCGRIEERGSIPEVSTHSRPKAAGSGIFCHFGFITVSTHSRPKAAGPKFDALHRVIDVSTHSRPKAAGHCVGCFRYSKKVSTHSRPKAAGHMTPGTAIPRLFQHTAARRRLVGKIPESEHKLEFQHTAARRRLEGRLKTFPHPFKFQHTAARRRLGWKLVRRFLLSGFQHTAARRRLGFNAHAYCFSITVSTHSRPKAAGPRRIRLHPKQLVSTHSRPKAAGITPATSYVAYRFQHTAARRRLAVSTYLGVPTVSFNTQPPEGGWRVRRHGKLH